MAELTQVVAEVAEEVAEQAEHVATVSRALSHREMRIAGIGLLIGVAGGGAVAYFVAGRRLQTKWTKIAEEEIAVMKDHYAAKVEAVMGRVKKPELEEVVQELGYKEAPHGEVIAVKEEEVVEVVDEVVVAPVVTKNVFEKPSPSDPWDYAEEVKRRRPDIPYVIHADEFEAGEKGYIQTAYTYYDDDDVLADTDDSVIDDQDEAVGVHNLARFGHGSKDPNVVFVRNDERLLDIEIVRSTGSYAEEVHGLPVIEHSMRRHRTAWDG